MPAAPFPAAAALRAGGRRRARSGAPRNLPQPAGRRRGAVRRWFSWWSRCASSRSSAAGRRRRIACRENPPRRRRSRRRRRCAPTSSTATASCWRRPSTARRSTPIRARSSTRTRRRGPSLRCCRSSTRPKSRPSSARARALSGSSGSLTPRQEYEVNRLGIPGLQFEHEERRVYPFGDLASHVVGFCGIDNNGLAGHRASA